MAQVQDNRVEGWIFDKKLNVGTIIAGLGLIGSIWGAASWVLTGVSEAKTSVAQTSAQLQEMKPKVDLILQIQTQQLNDGKRIDNMEQRIFEIEKDKAK